MICVERKRVKKKIVVEILQLSSLFTFFPSAEFAILNRLHVLEGL